MTTEQPKTTAELLEKSLNDLLGFIRGTRLNLEAQDQTIANYKLALDAMRKERDASIDDARRLRLKIQHAFNNGFVPKPESDEVENPVCAKNAQTVPAWPSPGDGWRWLESGEIIAATDESNLLGEWKPACAIGEPVWSTSRYHYRRRIEPEAGKAAPVERTPSIHTSTLRGDAEPEYVLPPLPASKRNLEEPTPPQVRVPLDMSDFLGAGRVTHVRFPFDHISFLPQAFNEERLYLWFGNCTWKHLAEEDATISRDGGVTWGPASKEAK